MLALGFLRAVDAAEADAFWALVVQDCEGIAVEDNYGFRGEGIGKIECVPGCCAFGIAG